MNRFEGQPKDKSSGANDQTNGQTVSRTFKVDLHTHSTESPDGGIKLTEYARMLETGLDYIAVTDHGTVAHARKLQATHGDRIIVGQEIMTTAGELIGLYLQQSIPDQLDLEAAVAAIRQQGGLVYVPHPFETTRHGLQADSLALIADAVDIVETHNGRAMFQNKSSQAHAWAAEHGCAMAASSDGHSASGWGRTYSVIAAQPKRDNLVKLLSQASYVTGFPGLRAVLAPKMNRLHAKLTQSRQQGEQRNDGSIDD